MAAKLEVVGNKTLLQTASVGKPTRRLYERLFDLVVRWVEWRGTHPQTEVEWDTEVALLMDMKYLDGEPSHFGEKLLASVTWMLPHLSRASGARMALTRQAIKGWIKLCPHGSRLPLPYCVVMLIVNYLVGKGLLEAAVLTWLEVETYCRPSEPLRLRCRDVVAGAAGAPPPHHLTSLVLHPLEMHIPSKTQEFDETVVLDLPRHQGLAEMLARMVAGRKPDEELFRIAAADLTKALDESAAELGLEALGRVHPYRLRHTGASHDFATKARTLAEIQRRGRWRDARSIRRYEKGGRLNELLLRLPAATQKLALQCEASVAAVVLGQRSPLRSR